MHPNPAFRQEPDVLHLNLVRLRGFGTLIVPVQDAVPMISHVPYLLSDDGQTLELHLVRSNPIFSRASAPTSAVLSVSGPDGYVSPDWYEDPDHGQVPTWNYVAVHLTGQLEAQPQITLRDHLDRLSASFEERLAPKPPWTSNKMPKGTMERMMRAIAVFRFTIDKIDGTWKLNQNKSEDQRLGAAEQIKHSPVGHETRELGEMMVGLGPRLGWE